MGNGPVHPQPLKADDDELHQKLARATISQELARLLHPHFVKEEEFALPSLGQLAPLARGEVPSPGAVQAANDMAGRLRAELPGMLAEHGRIISALEALAIDNLRADAAYLAPLSRACSSTSPRPPSGRSPL